MRRENFHSIGICSKRNSRCGNATDSSVLFRCLWTELRAAYWLDVAGMVVDDGGRRMKLELGWPTAGGTREQRVGVVTMGLGLYQATAADAWFQAVGSRWNPQQWDPDSGDGAKTLAFF